MQFFNFIIINLKYRENIYWVLGRGLKFINITNFENVNFIELRKIGKQIFFGGI